MKKNVIITLLVAFSLAVALFTVILVGGQSVEYDPWIDVNDDGKIDMKDIGQVARAFGATGTAINKTALLFELQDGLAELNATVADLQDQITQVHECIVVTGEIPYDANGAYDASNGLTKDVSGSIPSGYTLISVYATGYKAHQMTGARQNEPPLILEPKVSGSNIQTRVWDASGDEYGGASWSSMTAHIDYTLLITK